MASVLPASRGAALAAGGATRRRYPATVNPAHPSRPLASTLLGEHPRIVALRRLIDRVAASKARTVLIYGETGTERAWWRACCTQGRNRGQAPFVDINCAAIPGALLESELFGHEKGAFTGAVGHKPGLIEAADGGSVFLDETASSTWR